MSEESDTTKKAFLLFGDAMRSLNSAQQVTNTLLGEVVGELKALHRGHQEIIQRMDAAAERGRDMERRFSESERKSEGRIKVLEVAVAALGRTSETHGQQLATLRQSALKT